MRFEIRGASKLSRWVTIVGDPYAFAKVYLNTEHTRRINPRQEEALSIMLAAPDLLDALRATLEAIAPITNGDDIAGRPWLVAARAAIAKATGE